MMRRAAWDYVGSVCDALGGRFVTGKRVLDIWSRNVKGTVKAMIGRHCHEYVGIDSTPGPCVDIVADAASWRPPPGDVGFDTVVAVSVIDHTEHSDKICATAYEVLNTPGIFIATMSDQPVKNGFHRIISPEKLVDLLRSFSLVSLYRNSHSGDLASLAFKL